MSICPSENSKKNYLGVEIEYFSNIPNYDSTTIILKELGTTICEVGRDGSICINGDRRYCHAHEFCRAMSGEIRLLIDEETIDEVCDKLKVAISKIDGFNVNKSCGLHVHIDCRNRVKEVVFNNLVKMQRVLFKMQPEVRRKNRYCQQLPEDAKIDNFISRGDKYLAVNPVSYNRYKTIELRLAQGTTDTDDLRQYLKLLKKIAGKTTNLETSPLGSLTAKRALNLDLSLTRYIKSKIEKNRSAS